MKFLSLIVISVLMFGSCNSIQEKSPEKIVRKGAVIKVKPEKLDFYLELHANPWEGVNSKLKECNIQNYSIFYRNGYFLRQR